MGEVFEMAASLLRGSAARAYVIVLLAVLLFAAAPTVPAQADPQEPDAVVAEIDRFLSAELNEAAIPGAAVAVVQLVDAGLLRLDDPGQARRRPS